LRQDLKGREERRYPLDVWRKYHMLFFSGYRPCWKFEKQSTASDKFNNTRRDKKLTPKTKNCIFAPDTRAWSQHRDSECRSKQACYNNRNWNPKNQS